MNADKIPDIIIGRLPVYLRALQRMADNGIKTTSSQELGEHVGISAAQIRKDISQFGEFGKQKIDEFTIEDSEKLVERIKSAGIKIAMLTVPAPAAQSVADKLVQAGVRAILNYAPISLNVPNNVKVQYIDPATHLQRMTYYL